MLVCHRATQQDAAPTSQTNTAQPVAAQLPAVPRQVSDGAAVRIQRWYRHRQAERKVSLLMCISS